MNMYINSIKNCQNVCPKYTTNYMDTMQGEVMECIDMN